MIVPAAHLWQQPESMKRKLKNLHVGQAEFLDCREKRLHSKFIGGWLMVVPAAHL